MESENTMPPTAAPTPQSLYQDFEVKYKDWSQSSFHCLSELREDREISMEMTNEIINGYESIQEVCLNIQDLEPDHANLFPYLTSQMEGVKILWKICLLKFAFMGRSVEELEADVRNLFRYENESEEVPAMKTKNADKQPFKHIKKHVVSLGLVVETQERDLKEFDVDEFKFDKSFITSNNQINKCNKTFSNGITARTLVCVHGSLMERILVINSYLMSLSFKFCKDLSFCWGDIPLFVTVYDLELKILSFLNPPKNAILSAKKRTLRFIFFKIFFDNND